jgi:hypothetical protein
MSLHFLDGEIFAAGSCTYSYRPATEQDRAARIFVPIQAEEIPTEAVLDTGGVYWVCDPQIAALLGLNPADGLGTAKLGIRGRTFAGVLHRVSLTFLAEQGESCVVEVTAFVPDLHPQDEWKLPSFLGWMGCLERLRFAVDPNTDTFHFGSILNL